jgi:hypothetical protein
MSLRPPVFACLRRLWVTIRTSDVARVLTL